MMFKDRTSSQMPLPLALALGLLSSHGQRTGFQSPVRLYGSLAFNFTL